MILAVAFSLLVALFWLKKFRKMDKYEKEPERLIYTAFFAGVLAIFPSIALEFPLMMGGPHRATSAKDLLLSFLWVGIVEEVCKFLAVRLTVYRSNQFNEVMDGMIYMISAALGYAATENVGYMMGFGLSTGFLRAILSYLGHVSFSATLGYYLGRAKIENRGHLLWIGFVLAISLHCLYDAFLAIGSIKGSGEFLLLGLTVWGFGLVLTFVLAKKAQAISPFRTAHILPKRLTRQCQACGKTVSSRAWICHHCGEPLILDEEDITLRV